MELLTYLLEVSVCLAFFFAFYFLLLRNLTFFQFNRFFLLIGLLLSFVIPALQFNIEKTVEAPVPVPIEDVRQISAKQNVQTEKTELLQRSVAVDLAKTREAAVDWFLIISNTYLFGVAVFIIIAFARVAVLFGYMRKKTKQIDGLKVFDKRKGFTNCSFFKNVFVDLSNLSEEELSAVLKHEKIHAQQYHSADKILMMLAKAVLWFNPLIFLWDKALEEVHEAEADEATSLLYGTREYANVLLNLAVRKRQHQLVHSFAKSPLKKRIKMLYQLKSNKMKKLNYLFALPVAIALIGVFSIKLVHSQEKSASKNSKMTDTIAPLRVDVKTTNRNLKLAEIGNLKNEKNTVDLEEIDHHLRNTDKSTYVVEIKGEEVNLRESGTTKSVTIVNGLAFLKGAVKNMATDDTVDYGCKITKVENDDKYTIVSFEYIASRDEGDWVLLNKEIYIQANNDMKHFQYVKSEGIPLAPDKHYFTKRGEKLAFKVYFEKVPHTAKSIDVIERAGRSDFFNFYSVALPASYFVEK